MNLKAVIKAEKADLDLGKWSSGHIPRANFPLSKVKDKSFKFGPAYSWRIVKFSALGNKCRVLLILNEEKEIFRARLGIEQAGDMVVLCDYEFHSSEPGWHCHFTLADSSAVEPGAVRGSKQRRPRLENLSASFSATKANAVALAAARYGFEALGDLV